MLFIEIPHPKFWINIFTHMCTPFCIELKRIVMKVYESE